MFTLVAVLRSTTPILSATAMNRLLNNSSFTGCALVSAVTGREARRHSRRLRQGSTRARQPGSTMVVAMASRIIAGPSI